MPELQHIIALTKLHISQEYDAKNWVTTDSETYEYYKTFASKKRTTPIIKPPVSPIPVAPRPKPIAPKPSPQKKLPPKSTPIERETLPSAPKTEFADFKKIISMHFPNEKILNFVPDDTLAKEIASKWKKQAIPPEVVILNTTTSPQEKLFLENVARAIEIHFFPAAVLSPEEFKPNDALKLVIGNETQPSFPSLKIEPVANYLKNPQQKAKLWQDLKSTLQSS